MIDGFDGTTVEGTAEAGSTITVYDENGTEIGSGTADSTGKLHSDLGVRHWQMVKNQR